MLSFNIRSYTRIILSDSFFFLFQASSCSTTLPEDTPLGEFCSFSVSDADQDGTTMFELDLSGFSISPTTSIFDMTYLDGDTSASLILATALDFETTKTHTLTITVSYFEYLI